MQLTSYGAGRRSMVARVCVDRRINIFHDLINMRSVAILQYVSHVHNAQDLASLNRDISHT